MGDICRLPRVVSAVEKNSWRMNYVSCKHRHHHSNPLPYKKAHKQLGKERRNSMQLRHKQSRNNTSKIVPNLCHAMTEPAPVLLGRVRAPNNDANKKRISAPQEPAAPAPAPAVVPRGDAQRRMFQRQTWPWTLILPWTVWNSAGFSCLVVCFTILEDSAYTWSTWCSFVTCKQSVYCRL